MTPKFEWDYSKNVINCLKHGVSFASAQLAFVDPNRVIAEDTAHSQSEERYFCFGMVNEEVLSVRFTYRNSTIRIFGAGYWRKGKVIYERANQVHR
ncbi:BrnT family toxin [Rugamonas sp. CCM 8940]|uniref:BrnT family toxin n=1 Tax=Rugamonas sp. CCM 8940 TaxID=2765359 RepID=UPI0018F39943|nr:BrnT family toxin [Rugamonas sp. CCM 8940]MBJ7309404.1 BrnT family toxin [Rugamonas sp. CCM 8940]